MSSAIPNAEKYIDFQKIQDLHCLPPGWVVIAVLETECPVQVCLNNGQWGYGQQKSVEFLIGLLGPREQADLFQQVRNYKAEAEQAALDLSQFKKEREEKEKKLQEIINDQKWQLAGTKEMLDLRTKERDERGKEVERIRGEITRLKESMATVMLMVADNQKASVADLAEANMVGEKMGEEDAKAGG